MRLTDLHLERDGSDSISRMISQVTFATELRSCAAVREKPRLLKLMAHSLDSKSCGLHTRQPQRNAGVGEIGNLHEGGAASRMATRSTAGY